MFPPDLEEDDLDEDLRTAFFVGRERQEGVWMMGGDSEEGRLDEGEGTSGEAESMVSRALLRLVGSEDVSCISKSVWEGAVMFLPRWAAAGEPPSELGVGIPAGITLLMGKGGVTVGVCELQ